MEQPVTTSTVRYHLQRTRDNGKTFYPFVANFLTAESVVEYLNNFLTEYNRKDYRVVQELTTVTTCVVTTCVFKDFGKQSEINLTS